MYLYYIGDLLRKEEKEKLWSCWCGMLSNIPDDVFIDWFAVSIFKYEPVYGNG